eukprot:CAMPEP_0119144776 /NCGR_PEP_ID=MMETSP1310-20130426/36425_1 /TAXON_ID=464262 /ORGANISM="Genus nov. species nov., Strain RCC2339" /LENGTH=82 /DNA_ID=CAMNT_0007136549 /DNA_START=63 /DNA_END=308 /DNA_ORIENTATION=+
MAGSHTDNTPSAPARTNPALPSATQLSMSPSCDRNRARRCSLPFPSVQVFTKPLASPVQMVDPSPSQHSAGVLRAFPDNPAW